MKLIGLLSGCALALAATAMAMPASASTYVVGAGADSENCFPFGCTTGSNYQQVYASSDFTGPLAISGLTFYDSNYPYGATNTGSYTVSLSTTSAAVDGLSTTFADNLGADNTLVFTGSLPTLVTGTSITLPFSTTFDYNPAGGNLLVSITYAGGAAGGAYFDAYNGDAGGLFSRVHDFGSEFSDWGLETGFVTSAIAGVPEPGTWAMMLVGLGGVGLAMRRARRKTIAAAAVA